MGGLLLCFARISVGVLWAFGWRSALEMSVNRCAVQHCGAGMNAEAALGRARFFVVPIDGSFPSQKHPTGPLWGSLVKPARRAKVAKKTERS